MITLKKYSFLLPYLLMAVSLFFCLYRLDLTWFNTHMARDLFRSEHLFGENHIEWLGPEMGWDIKRLPGPFYYWLLRLYSVFESIESTLIVKVLITYSALFLFFQNIKKHFATDLLLNFLLLFSIMPVYIFTSRNLWNPSSIILFNLLQITCVLKFKETQKTKWIFLSALVACLGLQVHFSTSIGYLAFCISVLLNKKIDLKLKGAVVMCWLFFAAWLSYWYFANYMLEFKHQLYLFYGFNDLFLNRFLDIKYHISLSLLKLRDYDLFNFYYQSLKDLDLIPADLIFYISITMSYLFFSIWMYSLYVLIRKYKTEKNFFELYLVIYCLIFFFSIYILKNKENAPYRYGLCIYPIQFFILAYSVWLKFKEKPRFYKSFQYLCIFTFVFYFYFNIKMLQAAEITGRAHHTHVDNLELTYGHKKEIYDFVRAHAANDSDPFNSLHGRTINKFRLKEMNWEQNIYYFSLYKATGSKGFVYSQDLISREPAEKNWLISLSNLEQLKKDLSHPLHYTEFSRIYLPYDLHISYYDKIEKNVLNFDWKNTSLIMPLAFLSPDSFSTTRIKLNFTMKSGQFLNLLIDSNKVYNFAYKHIYDVKEVKINNTSVIAEKFYNGYFLVQNQYIYKLPNQKENKIEVILDVISKYNNFSRVDLFSTQEIMPQEEVITVPRQ